MRPAALTEPPALVVATVAAREGMSVGAATTVDVVDDEAREDKCLAHGASAADGQLCATWRADLLAALPNRKKLASGEIISVAQPSGIRPS
jgi:hypothetical protein